MPNENNLNRRIAQQSTIPVLSSQWAGFDAALILINPPPPQSTPILLGGYFW